MLKSLFILSSFIIISLSTTIFSFGQNKVQYKKFKWHYVKSTHFDVYYNKGDYKLAEDAAKILEKSLKSISTAISYNIKKRIPVIVYSSHSKFQQTNIIFDIPEGVGGFTELLKSRIVIPFEGSYAGFNHVLHHELVHAVMFDLIFGDIYNALKMNIQFNIPLWVAEGWAEHESVKWDLDSDMFLMDAVLSGHIASPADNFGGYHYMAYKGGMAFFNYMSVQYGDKCVGKFLKYLKFQKDVEKAFRSATGDDLKRIGKQFIFDLKKLYWPELAKRIHPEEIAKRMTKHRQYPTMYPMPGDAKAFVNLQPIVSPNGKLVAYYSDRDDYLGLQIMSAKSGKHVKELLKSGGSGQFESFHAYRSGISWSSDSKRITFVSKSLGKDILRTLEVKSGKEVWHSNINMEKITSPACSFDDSLVAFSGVRNHRQNIFVLNKYTNVLRQLTHDSLANNHPNFSNNGRYLVFDRENAKVEYGCSGFDVFMIDLKDNNIRQITTNKYDDLNPVFSPNDSGIYFVSNRTGLKNIYYLDISQKKVNALTNVYCGAFTPSIDSAGKYLFFSVYESNGWDIYRMSNPQDNLLDSLPQLTEYMKKLEDSTYNYITKRRIPLFYSDTLDKKIVLDTIKKDTIIKTDSMIIDSLAWEHHKKKIGLSPYSGIVEEKLKKDYFKKRRNKLIDTTSFIWDSTKITNKDGHLKSYKYSPLFTVDALALTIAGGVAGNGYAVGGQGYASLSDLMGSHRLTMYANLNAYGDFDNSNYYLSYGYLPNRIDYYTSVSKSKQYSIIENTDSTFVYNDDAIYDFASTISYPFSKFMRTDLILGMDYVSRTKRFHIITDTTIEQIDSSLSSFNNFQLGTHLSFDNTIWGATGPINGQRLSMFALLVPTLENSNNSYAIAYGDFRKYFRFFKKYTLAARISAGATKGLLESRNPYKFYLGGSPGDLRYFFNYWSAFSSTDGNSSFSIVSPLRGFMLGEAYTDFDGLALGKTNFGLMNLELRFPFIYNISLMFPIPININYIMGAVFLDLGTGFNNLSELELLDKDKNYKDLRSGMGFGLRMNMFGMMILRWDRAWGKGGLGHKIDYFSIGTEF